MLNKFLDLFIIGLLFSSQVISQVTPEIKSRSFHKRLSNPIDIDIKESSSGASIVVNNQSYYRYLIELKYTSVLNLKASPGMVRKIVVANGYNNVASIPSVNNSMPVDLQVFSSSQICPSNYEKGDFTYLYPIGNNKNMKEFVFAESQQIYLNKYQMKRNDTIYAMRKGIVVNTEDKEELLDRLGPEGSFEILHDDGTVMIYNGISSHIEEIKRGKVVYPGQPIGIMDGDENVLSVFLCYIQPNATITQMNINYTTDYFKEMVKSSGKADCIITYPQELIMSEMSKSEKKKYLSGKLL